MVLKICEPELTYILVNLFNTSLKEPCFLDYWKVSTVSLAVIAKRNTKAFNKSGCS